MQRFIKYTFLILFLSTGIMNIMAQRDSVMISGIVYDYDSREALSNATFKHNGELIDISEDGKFQLYVKPSDSLSFRYLGYKDYVLVVPDDLDQVSYISGVFLNKTDIAGSESIIEPREYEVESLATYDPTQRKQMLENAQRTVAVASYQATQPYEWDAYANTKNSMAVKNMEVEYRGMISPAQQIAVGAVVELLNPLETVELDKRGSKSYASIDPLSPIEEFYIMTLFEARTQQKNEK